jgi:hypothetical protein
MARVFELGITASEKLPLAVRENPSRGIFAKIELWQLVGRRAESIWPSSAGKSKKLGFMLCGIQRHQGASDGRSNRKSGDQRRGSLETRKLGTLFSVECRVER